ncbi:O-antigen ligase family protein [Paenibacillus sp. MZ04-78.2]|uniref:O-antigen ligase family protein n=1 Tax=Paenibacillus sp. MZ04-78.2 TaxID=2962034 RepID=UPI0020B678DF|nr:O-antigen ligase family protein [Paenibacillus sp. MZ04-78.2]MCP3776473.1 O-antigen ligase family protein [Paenibacillus sp. MZ04-78.2]
MTSKVNSYAADKKSKISKDSDRNSILFWILISFLVLFLFWSPFQRALFNGGDSDFETPIYSSLIWISIVMCLIAIYLLLKFRLRDQKDGLMILILLIPLTYLISLTHATSHYLATNMLYIQILYCVFFILGVILTKNKIGNYIISGTLMTSGYSVVLFGLLYWLGNGALGDHLVGWFAAMGEINNQKSYLYAVMTDSNGSRLTSVFQYANSYAGYLIALIMGALYFIVKSHKWYAILPHALMMVPMIISFWLTLSRGALVFLPIILLVIMFFLNVTRQILCIIQIGLSFIASLIILQKITDIGIIVQQKPNSSEFLQGWLLLILVSSVYSVIAIMIQMFGAAAFDKALSRVSSRKYISFVLPITAILVGCLGAILLFGDTGLKNVMPNSVKTRIENINIQQHSVLERGTFYKDAIKIWKDHPIIGAGGGAWAALYEKYQNNPYSSRQDHNFFLQYLVETGVVGILVLMSFLVCVFYFYIRSFIDDLPQNRERHFLFFIITISLLIHSMIDFDLSYVYLGSLMFLSLGGMTSGATSIQLPIRTNSKILQKTYPLILLVLSLIMIFVSTQLFKASKLFQKTYEISKTSHNYNEIVAPLDAAMKLHPNHPYYVLKSPLSKVNLLLQVYNQTKDDKYFEEAQRLINQLKQSELHDLVIVLQQINMMKMKNQLQQAYDLINNQIPEFPWYIEMYESSIELGVQLGDQARQEKNFQTMDTYWNHSLELYNEVLRRMDLLKNLPKGQLAGRDYNITPQISYSIGQINFLRGDYAAASNILKLHAGPNVDDPTTRMIDRWYLSALQKQGQNDRDLYDKLVGKDSSEKQQIEFLTTTDFLTK